MTEINNARPGVTAGPERDRRAAEQWFRRRGLPAVVRGRPRQVLVRTLPAVVWLALTDLLQDMLEFLDGDTDLDFDRRLDSLGFVALYLLTLAASVVVPAVAGWLAVRLARGWVLHRRGRPAAGLLAACYVLAEPVAHRLLDDGRPYLPDVVTNAGAVVLILALTAAGVGSICGWALRAALRQLRGLGAMTSRSLPMLLLVTTFGFFTTEIWQTSGVLGGGRIWLVAGFFGLVGGLFLLSVLSAELETITSLPGPPDPAAGNGPALTRLERGNMVLVLLLTEVLQALVFGLLMFVLFVILGLLAVPKSAMSAWAGHAVTHGSLGGVQIPVAQELLQVSMFIAAFSALYFIVTVVTDAAHRRTFFDPVLNHLKVSLAERASYLARFGPPGVAGRVSAPLR